MTISPAARPAPPPPECAPWLIGLCAGCLHRTHRYGEGGNPLCVLCRQALVDGR
ncbi:hypothetical protein [Streptomyces sp. AD55]|uniref:hypothetical protein n=1 Tax=Streptomyces sp. AD55 TaxID=3242895 RepID=UPI003527A00F